MTENQCSWKRAQVKNAHGEITRYGRRCIWNEGHTGLHEVPKRAKQSNDGVWFNSQTGETFTQREFEQEEML